MRLSRAARIRRTAHSSGGGGGGAQEEGSSASLPSTAWHGGSMCFAPTLSKHVILAEVFLIHFLSLQIALLSTIKYVLT